MGNRNEARNSLTSISSPILEEGHQENQGGLFLKCILKKNYCLKEYSKKIWLPVEKIEMHNAVNLLIFRSIRLLIKK